MPDQQTSDRALLIVDNSVHSHKQSGGLTPETVNASTIDFAGSPAADGWMAKAVERFWRFVFDLSY